jgi:hypothetical protein
VVYAWTNPPHAASFHHNHIGLTWNPFLFITKMSRVAETTVRYRHEKGGISIARILDSAAQNECTDSELLMCFFWFNDNEVNMRIAIPMEQQLFTRADNCRPA